MITKNDVTEALRTVLDPEIGVNIVDLGLIYDIDIKDEKLEVTMTLTTPGCPMHSSILMWVETNLQKVAEQREVKVNLVWEPAWTPERMTEEAKKIING